MELFKCKYCGGYLSKKDSLTLQCQSCGQTYDLSYKTEYEDKTGFFNEYGNQVKQCINDMRVDELSNIINAYADSQSSTSDDMFYSQYEVEYTIICIFAEIVERYLHAFEKKPYGTNELYDLANVVANLTDLTHAVAQKTNSFINYDFIMSWFSDYLYSFISRAYAYESDKWNKKSHDEDSAGWDVFINAMLNCNVIFHMVDKHGDNNTETVYKKMIEIQERILTLTYTHRYWIGSYHASEQLGLDNNSKEIQRKKLSEIKARYERASKNNHDKQAKRQKEEDARLEAERKERIDAFWAENKELKNNLIRQKSELEKEILELEAKKTNTNADKEINDLKEDIQLANSTLATLGLFAIKEKKQKREHIARLERELQDVRTRVKKEKDDIQKIIDEKKAKISDIENEFIIDR